MVDFEYDDRGRLISEERTVGQTDVYDLAYTYDQLGNRQSKVDAVSGQWVVYDYDVDLADPNALEFPTWHNRLLEYRMYDRDPNDPNTILLRTVSYTYYKTGQASNITVKDEDPDPDPINGPDPAYDVYQDLALYYHSHGPLWRALWGSYTLDQSGDPTGYETSWAREFFYDSPRQRFLAADYNTNGYDDEPDRWTWNTGLWTEYSGELPYADLETTRYLPDEQNHPHQHAYTRTETLHYLGTAAQQTTDTPPETAFHHGDLIGSTNLTTDNSGDANQTPAVAYTAFGEIIGDASTLATRYQYAGAWGYESDLLALSGVNTNLADITLQHVGERWYQPDIGRFVQRDPIGIQGGLNVYVYCSNSPLGSVDPSGLDRYLVLTGTETTIHLLYDVGEGAIPQLIGVEVITTNYYDIMDDSVPKVGRGLMLAGSSLLVTGALMGLAIFMGPVGWATGLCIALHGVAGSALTLAGAGAAAAGPRKVGTTSRVTRSRAYLLP